MSKKDATALRLTKEYIPLQEKYHRFSNIIHGIVVLISKNVGRKYQIAGSVK